MYSNCYHCFFFTQFFVCWVLATQEQFGEARVRKEVFDENMK